MAEYFLVLTFSVVANGCFLAYVEKRRSLSSLRLCDLALYQRNEKDAKVQGRERMKSPNFSASFKKTTESIRIRRNSRLSTSIHVSDPAPYMLAASDTRNSYQA